MLVLVSLDDALMDVGKRERVQGLTAMWKSEHLPTPQSLCARLGGLVPVCTPVSASE